MFENTIEFIRSLYPGKEVIPLHEPHLGAREKERVAEAIDTGYVSSIGAFVDQFEEMICAYTGAAYAVATVNGTSALHTALMVAGVQPGDEVLTQPLTFVATANAIQYCGAAPVFIDIEQDTMGLSPESLASFLTTRVTMKKGVAVSKISGNRIGACLPVHIFGHPCRIDEIVELCNPYRIPVVEDSAEAMGTRYKNIHAGCFGKIGAFSFNGNKIITAGGGGAIITNDENIAKIAKHLTTTARCPDPLAFYHDMVGYNYRMPNLNAALACAQMEQLDLFVENKRCLAKSYGDFFKDRDMGFVFEPEHAASNYWLNTVVAENKKTRDLFLTALTDHGIMARPVWRLMNQLAMYSRCYTHGDENATFIADRAVSLPSSVTV